MAIPTPQQARREWWKQFIQLYAVALIFTMLVALLSGFAGRNLAGGAYDDAGFPPEGQISPAGEFDLVTPEGRSSPAGELIASAEQALIHNQLEEAARAADEALALDPYSEAAMAIKANALFERFWVTGSSDDLQVVRGLLTEIYDPQSAQAYTAVGNLALVDGDTASAVTALQQAVTVDPNNAYAQHQLGYMLVAAGRPETAIAHFERALQLAPQMAWVQANLLDAMLRLGECDRTVEGLQLEIVGNCHNQLGISHYNTGDFTIARESFQRAVDLAPDSATYHLNLAGTYLQLGERDAATSHARQARRLGAAQHWVLDELAIP